MGQALKLKKPLTRSGYQQIAEEHRMLLEDVRPGVVDGIATAAAEGDRSENAEYIYGKKRLREIDKKLRQLTALIKDCDIVDPENIRSSRVEFGATVTLEAEDGAEKVWSIVGIGEADATQGTISWKSPVAKAMMGKSVGDDIIVQTPSGEVDFLIVAIRYQPIHKGKSIK